MIKRRIPFCAVVNNIRISWKNNWDCGQFNGLQVLRRFYSFYIQFTRTQNRMRILFLVLVVLLALIPEIAAKIPNPYKVLGIRQDASEDQIKEGFKKRSKKYHPDRNKKDPRAKEKFEKIANAYELLKDPERRRIYDMTGDDNPQAQQGGPGFGGFGFPGGGFGFGGIDIEQLMRQGFFHQGEQPGGHGRAHGHGQGGHGQGQGRRGGQRQTTYTFSFGGGQGIRFEF